MAKAAVSEQSNITNLPASDQAKGVATTGVAVKETKRSKKSEVKKSGGLGLKLILFITAFIVLVIAALVLAVITNFKITPDRGARDILRDFVVGIAAAIDPSFTNLEDTIEARRIELDGVEEELTAREADVLSQEEALRKQKLELDARDRTVSERESIVVPIYRKPLSEQEVEDMESIARVYAAMDAADAAQIMSNLYTTRSMAAIIYYMSERKAAPILSAMDVRIAAEITELLLSE